MFFQGHKTKSSQNSADFRPWGLADLRSCMCVSVCVCNAVPLKSCCSPGDRLVDFPWYYTWTEVNTKKTCRCKFQAFTSKQARTHIYTCTSAAADLCPWGSPSSSCITTYTLHTSLTLNLYSSLWHPHSPSPPLDFLMLTWNFLLATKYCILRKTFTADLWAWDNLWKKERLMHSCTQKHTFA